MKYLSIVPMIVLIAFISSCTKVIDVNYKDSAPQYVIEGNISDQPGPYTVKITKSKKYDADNVFPTVSGAIVIITDNNTVIDTLEEVHPGIYQTHTIKGVSGHVYTLLVKAEGKEFVSASTMPLLVTVDSLYTSSVPEFGGVRICATPVYTDPATTGNFYHYVAYVNDTATKDVYAYSDDFLNGQKIEFPLSSDRKLIAGDKIKVELQSIDENMYQYYNSLLSSSFAATPANPISNISGGALGYFSAHTKSLSKTIIVP